MNVLFVCTSGKDRSASLARVWKFMHPTDTVSACGINRCHTGHHGTHYCPQYHIEWADKIICAEEVHRNYLLDKYGVESICVYFGEHGKEDRKYHDCRSREILMRLRR